MKEKVVWVSVQLLVFRRFQKSTFQADFFLHNDLYNRLFGYLDYHMALFPYPIADKNIIIRPIGVR